MSFFANGTIEGFGGCNDFSGSYTVKGDSLTVGPLMSTMMACPDPAGTFETQFMTALQNSTKWSVSAGTLDLRDDGGAQQVERTDRDQVGRLNQNVVRPAFRGGADATAGLLDEPLHDGQADARATGRTITRLFDAVEPFPHPRQLIRRYFRARVGDPDGRPRCVSANADQLDRDRAAGGRIAHGVLE